MSDLNSILIEGTIEDPIEFVTEEEGTPLRCYFTIRNNRAYKEEYEGDLKQESHVFVVTAEGKLAVTIRKQAKAIKDRTSVRVVGRLVGSDDPKENIRIKAEFVEFRIKRTLETPDPEDQ